MELTHHFQDIVWPTSAETSNLPTNRWVTVKVLPEETFKDGAEALWDQLTQQGFPLSTKETSELRITLSNIQWDAEGEEDTFGGLPEEFVATFRATSEDFDELKHKTFEELSDEATEQATDAAGWCIHASDVKTIEIV